MRKARERDKLSPVKVMWMVVGAIVAVLVLGTAFAFGQWAAPKGTGPEAKGTGPEGMGTGPAAIINADEICTVLIRDIDSSYIEGLNLDKKVEFVRQLRPSVQASDVYGKIMPVSQLRQGDIVDVSMDASGEVLSISKSPKAIVLRYVNNVRIDKITREVIVDGERYPYKIDTIMPEELSEYDTVTIQILDGNVWSIIMEEESASITLTDVPVSNGYVQIDHGRIVEFKNIAGPITVAPGRHSIVVNMEGYYKLADTIDLAAGENLDLSLASSEIALCNLTVKTNTDNYTIKVGDKTYKKGDRITVQYGDYDVIITADGCRPWVAKVALKTDDYVLTARLSKIAVTTPEPTGDGLDTNNTNDSNGDRYQTGESSGDGLIIDNEPVSGDRSLNNTNTDGATTNGDGPRNVTITTNPVGCKIYINGDLKGQTPYQVTLKNGRYSLILEKEGYEIYNTTIVIDNDSRSEYKYILTEK